MNLRHNFRKNIPQNRLRNSIRVRFDFQPTSKAAIAR